MSRRRISIILVISLVIIVTGGLLLWNFTKSTTTAVIPPPSKNRSYPASQGGPDRVIGVYATWYGYDDNSGDTETQHGSNEIAYPANNPYPTVHNSATEGTGTYNDPITFAATDKAVFKQKIFPIGSIIYVPFVKKYFVAEDQCGDSGDCQRGHPYHVDLWMGPSTASDAGALNACEDRATQDSTIVIINPGPSYPVDTMKMFQNNTCSVHLYHVSQASVMAEARTQSHH